MEKSRKKDIHSEGQNGMGDEAWIVLDGKATKEAPEEPSLVEKAKEAMENIGTEINGI